ncbi:MAG: hypothetical protein KAX64_00555 [Chromatiaceae bacterium]|nr:hypothetical protein [Chromatiaceae bacterium]
MKTAILSALLLTGCAAQPYQAPTASYPPPVDHESDCIKAVIAINVFSDMATPMLKKCNAGNTGECIRFSLFFDKVKGNLQPDRIVECVDNRWLSVFHPQVAAFRAKTPVMNAQLERFTRRIGK